MFIKIRPYNSFVKAHSEEKLDNSNALTKRADSRVVGRSIMKSVRLPVMIKFHYQKIAVHKSSNFASLIILIRSGIQVYLAKCCHESSFSRFSEKSLWSRFSTTLLGPRLDDTVINITVISTLCMTRLSIAVKIASSGRVSTAATTVLTSFLALLVIFLSISCVWHARFSTKSWTFPKSLRRSSSWTLPSRFQLQLLWYFHQKRSPSNIGLTD